VKHRRPGRPPVAFINWETAGPVDPLVELAQLTWLNAKLHDDILAATGSRSADAGAAAIPRDHRRSRR
jgi:aminoglycoside phosphotransferase (APT) family kinase protein